MDRGTLAFCWFVFAVLGLSVSGVFAGFIAIARMPGISLYFTDIDFFRRALAVHVDLAVLVWFLSLPVAFFHLLQSPAKVGAAAKFSLSISLAGVLLLFFSAFSPKGVPHLSNYVSVISHPMFVWGIALFLAGIAMNYVSPGLMRLQEPPGDQAQALEKSLWTSQFGIRLAALYFLLSLGAFLLAAWNTPRFLPSESYFEVLLWGGGHVLQFSNIAFMLVAWILILSSWKEGPILTRAQAFVPFVWLGLPALLMPFVASMDPTGSRYREGFTLFMRWGLFPPVLCFLAMVLPALFKGPRKNSFWDVRILSFWLSVLLILNGFVFGAFVRGPNLTLPGHYHSSIGAVTLAFMGASYVLMSHFSKRLHVPFASKAALANALCYGIGQIGFSAGMFVAGVYGLARKTYGVEQQIKNSGQTLGLYIMGIGGGFAFLGGLIFAYLMLRVFWGLLRKAQKREQT